MPQTINKSDDYQIIAGVFSDRENADKAIEVFQEAGVPPQNIETLFQTGKGSAPEDYVSDLQKGGIAESQAKYYDNSIRAGKLFVAVNGVIDPKPIIDIFDRFGAEYNPDGSRNVRQDVAGMTAGTGAGAVIGGAVGLVVGGPLGAAAGATAGAVVGGGAGAAAGKSIEHGK